MPAGIDLGLVHAGGVEVADDLVDAGGVLVRRRFLGQLVAGRRANGRPGFERPQLVRSAGTGFAASHCR